MPPPRGVSAHGIPLKARALRHRLMSMSKATETRTREVRTNERKWTTPLMDAGWTVIPSVILEYQKALGLDPLDLNIILQLAKHWWYVDSPPRPTKKTLAECMGVDASTIRRHIARLEKLGYIGRSARFGGKEQSQQANAYHFDGLVKKVTPLAKEMIAAKKERRVKADAAKVEAAAKGKRLLRLVGTKEG